MMYKNSKQYFTEEQKDPLLAVNRDGASMGVEDVPSNTPMRDELRRTWTKLKISMFVLLFFALIAMCVLIAGCVAIATAANGSRASFDTLVSDIGLF